MSFPIQITMDRSRTEGKGDDRKRVSYGTVQFGVPSLKDIAPFCAHEPKEFDKDSGAPIYESKEAEWIHSAIITAVAAMVRNRRPITADGKIDTTAALPESFEDLVATADRSGDGLAAYREAIQMFKLFLEEQGKPEKYVAGLVGGFSSSKAAAIMSESGKRHLRQQLEGFKAALPDDLADRYKRTIDSTLESVKEEAFDFDSGK